MKLKKLMITLITVVTLVLMMSVNVFAAGEGSITVTNTNTAVSIEGNTYSAYKLFDVTYSADKTSYVYTIDPTFTAFFTALGVKGDKAAYTYVMAQDPTDFAAAARAYIIANSVPADGSQTVANDPEKVIDTCTISPLDLGYYLVRGTATAPDSQTITSLCMLNTTTPNVTVNPKLDVPKIDLQIQENSLAGTPDEWGEVADYTVGDTVPYRLVSKVPDMNGYTDYTFTVTDTLASGLTSNNNVTVTIGGVTYTDFTVVPNGQSFDVVFGDSFINQTPGAAIEIKFTATLNDDAVIYNGDNANTAYLTYSSNPYNPASIAVTPTDEVLVDSYRLDILKYTGDLNLKKYLANAHFSLKLTDVSTASSVAFVVETDGSYRVATTAEKSDITVVKTTDLVSDVNGEIAVTGIDEGTYYLFETQAPSGYNLLSDSVTVTVTREFDSAIYANANTVAHVYMNGTENGAITVQNNTGIQLPVTGGMGTTIFTVSGIVIMAVAAAILLVRKKGSHNNK